MFFLSLSPYPTIVMEKAGLSEMFLRKKSSNIDSAKWERLCITKNMVDLIYASTMLVP